MGQEGSPRYKSPKRVNSRTPTNHFENGVRSNNTTAFRNQKQKASRHIKGKELLGNNVNLGLKYGMEEDMSANTVPIEINIPRIMGMIDMEGACVSKSNSDHWQRKKQDLTLTQTFDSHTILSELDRIVVGQSKQDEGSTVLE